MAELDTNLNTATGDPATSVTTTTTANPGIYATTTTGTTASNVNAADTAAAADTADTAELARLRAEMAKQKAALDKATQEAANYKKELRSRQSADEIAAEEKRIADEARDKELADLRKRFAVAEAAKKVMTFVGDENASTQIAEYLYGAEDADGAIDAFNKAWNAREKALRLEYGKIPAPGAGGSDGPTITREQLDAMGYKDRVKFATEHPAAYDRLMGRA